MIRTEDEERVKELCSRIKDTLVSLNKAAGVDYELTACIGYSSYDGDIGSFPGALKEADEALYKEKALRK